MRVRVLKPIVISGSQYNPGDVLEVDTLTEGQQRSVEVLAAAAKQRAPRAGDTPKVED